MTTFCNLNIFNIIEYPQILPCTHLPAISSYNTYSVVNDFNPANASCAIREMLLFDKSMRRKRLKLEKAFGVISVIEFCSKRLKIENKLYFFFYVYGNCVFFGRWWSMNDRSKSIDRNEEVHLQFRSFFWQFRWYMS